MVAVVLMGELLMAATVMTAAAEVVVDVVVDWAEPGIYFGGGCIVYTQTVNLVMVVVLAAL